MKMYMYPVALVGGCFLIFILSGCGDKARLTQLQRQNDSLLTIVETLRSQIETISMENSRLKKTAEYHYRQGIDLLTFKDYEGSRDKFSEVIEKYPNHPLAATAKEKFDYVNTQIREIERKRQIEKAKEEQRRREAEKKLAQSRSEKERFNEMALTSYNDIVLEPKRYLYKQIKMEGGLLRKLPDKEYFVLKNGDNLVHIYYSKLPLKSQREILETPEPLPWHSVVVRGEVRSHNYGGYYLVTDYIEIK